MNQKECEKATIMDWLKAQNSVRTVSILAGIQDSHQATPKYQSKVLLPQQICSVSVITHTLGLMSKPGYDHHDSRRK